MDPDTIHLAAHESEALADFLRLHDDGTMSLTRQGDGSLYVSGQLKSMEVTTAGTVIVDGEENDD